MPEQKLNSRRIWAIVLMGLLGNVVYSALFFAFKTAEQASRAEDSGAPAAIAIIIGSVLMMIPAKTFSGRDSFGQRYLQALSSLPILLAMLVATLFADDLATWGDDFRLNIGRGVFFVLTVA